MSHLFWLDQEHLKPIQHLFPKPRGVARADDRKVLSGIIHVIRNGLRWRDAPPDYGPHRTFYNRWARWSRMGVRARKDQLHLLRYAKIEWVEDPRSRKLAKLLVSAMISNDGPLKKFPVGVQNDFCIPKRDKLADYKEASRFWLAIVGIADNSPSYFHWVECLACRNRSVSFARN